MIVWGGYSGFNTGGKYNPTHRQLDTDGHCAFRTKLAHRGLDRH